MKQHWTAEFLEQMARSGYVARGVVYCIVAGLALLAAFGAGRGIRGSTGALQTLLTQPFGRALLLLIAIGLTAFAAWRIVQAALDPDGNGTSWKAMATRVGYAIGAVSYLGLSVSALSLAIGWGVRQKGGNEAAQDWTGWVLSQPYGPWITGAIAIGVICTGIGFAVAAWSGAAAKHLNCNPVRRSWVLFLGRLGYTASGVVYGLIGIFLLFAALRSNAGEARGLAGALAAIQAEPYGSVLLAIVATGLFAFGLFGIIQGIYRHIDPPELKQVEHFGSKAAREIAHG
jgi:hypothetical protein